MINKKITIYTDGACSGNPGIGSWAAILIYNDIEKEISGKSDAITTNNKMELTAVIESLQLLKEKCEIDLYTDSKYVQLGITEWIHNWIKNNWKNSSKKSIENKELWVKLLELTTKHNINFIWVKGHSNNYYNNKVDKIASNLLKQ